MKIIESTPARLVLRDFSLDTFMTGIFTLILGIVFLVSEPDPINSAYGFIAYLPFSLLGPLFSGIALLAMGLFLISRAPITSITLDKAKSACDLMGLGITKYKKMSIPFKDIKSVVIEADFYESRFNNPMLAYYLALDLKDGRKLNLKYASLNLNETGKKKFDSLMERVKTEPKRMADFMGVPAGYLEPPEMQSKLPKIISKMR